MDRELLIKNVIGKVLEPERFSYKGRSEGISEFLREVKNSKGETVRQFVTVQDSQYRKLVFLNLDSAPAGHREYRIGDFVPGCKEKGLYFENEEEYRGVIETYANILKEYGIPFLEKIKEPIISDYFVEEDMEKLFYEHEYLLESLTKRENIKAEEFDVEQAAEFIEKKVEEVKEKSFEEVRNLLLELSALFGAVANQFYPCHWTLDEFLILSCRLEFPESRRKETGWEAMFVLSTLFVEWKPKGPSRLRSKTPEGIKKRLLNQYMYCTL